MTKEPGKSPERAPRPRLRPKPSGARGGSDLKAPEARPKPGRQRKRARKEPGKSPAPKAPPEPLVFLRFGAADSGVSKSLQGSRGSAEAWAGPGHRKRARKEPGKSPERAPRPRLARSLWFS